MTDITVREGPRPWFGPCGYVTIASAACKSLAVPDSSPNPSTKSCLHSYAVCSLTTAPVPWSPSHFTPWEEDDIEGGGGRVEPSVKAIVLPICPLSGGALDQNTNASRQGRPPGCTLLQPFSQSPGQHTRPPPPHPDRSSWQGIWSPEVTISPHHTSRKSTKVSKVSYPRPHPSIQCVHESLLGRDPDGWGEARGGDSPVRCSAWGPAPWVAWGLAFPPVKPQYFSVKNGLHSPYPESFQGLC